MRYPSDLLDEIRSRLPVSRVVEKRVKLKRAGREYTGLSPFKTERTPSFTVNDQKGFYHCFASGEHGDIFTFLIKTEGLTFTEAVERLAAEAGVTLPEQNPVNEEKSHHLERLRAAMEAACQFFQANLLTREGELARSYLLERGVQNGETKAFRLGYALDNRSALKTHLVSKGFSAEELQDAGLLIHGDDIPVSYDRFRGRLIFPIADGKGRVVAFGGRALIADQQPKYLNSPETALFHKGRVLFNLSAARETARSSKAIVVAEGYMDVIALARAGFPNSVAPLGTAVTEDQLRLLWSVAPAPTLCFDGDAAGQKAASRALDVALPHLEPGRSLQFVFLPEGQDPDDMVRKGRNDELAALLNSPVSLFDVLWRREQSRHPLDTPELRAAFEDRLMGLVGQISHKTLRFHYLSSVRERLRSQGGARPWSPSRPQTSPEMNWRERSSLFRRQGVNVSHRPAKAGAARPAPTPPTSSLLASAMVTPSKNEAAAREALLIKALLFHPWLLDDFAEEIAEITFENPDCGTLRNELLAVHQAELTLDNKMLREHLSRRGYEPTIKRVQAAVTHRADSNFDADAGRETVLEGWNHILALHTCASALTRELQEAEEDYLRNPNSENFARVHAIRQQVEIAIP